MSAVSRFFSTFWLSAIWLSTSKRGTFFGRALKAQISLSLQIISQRQKRRLHFSSNFRLTYLPTYITGRPDKFVKKRPKFCPTHSLSKSITNFYYGKKKTKCLGYFCDFRKNCRKRTLAQWAKNRPLWSPCMHTSFFFLSVSRISIRILKGFLVITRCIFLCKISAANLFNKLGVNTTKIIKTPLRIVFLGKTCLTHKKCNF
jgi:hypothetical protein